MRQKLPSNNLIKRLEFLWAKEREKIVYIFTRLVRGLGPWIGLASIS